VLISIKTDRVYISSLLHYAYKEVKFFET